MKLLLITLALLMSTVASAHTDEYLDTQKAPQGGQMRMAGVYHFELLAKNGQDVVIFVTDHAGKKIATTGATGTATILSGKSKTSLTLNPDGDNRLKGSGKYTTAPNTKIVITVVMAGKPAEQARFTPLAKPTPQDGHKEHQH